MSEPNAITDYATNPRRTEAGAHALLRAQLEQAQQARQLCEALLPHSQEEGRIPPNAEPDKELLEIIQLRLAEAQILAGRL